MSARRLRVRCRQIRESDLPAILGLLLKSNFVGNRLFWASGLHRLSQHPPPPGFPQFGYLLEVNGVVAGMILVISAKVPVDGQMKVRCNVSCWYVWPAFQAYGSLLVTQALKHKEATYINISPLAHTYGLVAAQGYTRYCEGSFTCLPALSSRWPKVEIALATPELQPGADLSAGEIELLLKHVGYGCIGLIATLGGCRIPFVFELTRRYRVLGTAYLVYSQSIEDFVRLSGPLGWYLARRGFPFVALDANGPIPGLIGRYTPGTPKYFKGPDRPRLGDVAYSERVLLGLRLSPRVEPDI
jgi:hypothetical protein